MTDTANTGSTTLATDPVQGTSSPTSTEPTQEFKNPQETGTSIEQQLADFLASQKKEAPKETDPERPTGGANDLTVDDVADPKAKRVITILDTHYPKLDRERVIGRALEFGDPELIDVNYLRDQVGDMSDTLLGFFEELVTDHTGSYDSLVEEVYEYVGGKEQWGLISSAFTQNAPSSIKSIVKQLVDSKDRGEVEQGLKFIYDYSEKLNLVDRPAKRVNTGGGKAGGDALSSADFSKALKELGHRNKDPKHYDATVASLLKRRETGVTLGL